MAPRGTAVHEAELLTPDENQILQTGGPKQSSWYTPGGWLLEIFSMITSVCSTLALAILLFKAQDKPLNDWTVHIREQSIQLNVWISTLTTIVRVTLLLSVSACISQGKWLHLVKQSKLQVMEVYDEASRGALGSLKMILHVKTYLGLSTLAAVITVLALGMGPLAQQVVFYSQGYQNISDDSVSFSYTHRYDSGAPILDTGRPGSTDNAVDLNLQSAIYRGLYQKQGSWTQDFACPGNCTWPGSITVLGFAGTCENVTVATLATKTCSWSELHSAGIQGCSMTTPAGVTINTVFLNTDYATFSALNATATDQLDATGQENLVPGPTIARYAYYNRQTTKFNESMESDPESVWDCSLSFTAFEYSQVNFTLNALTIGRTRQIPLGPGYIQWSTDTSDDYSAYNRSYLSFNQSDIPEKAELSINVRDWGAIKGFFLSTLFTGSSVQGESQPTKQLGCNQAFQQKSALEVTQKLAKSMTDMLQSNPAHQLWGGKYHPPITNVQVRWMWLIFLAGLEASGSILLIGTIIRARQKQDVHLWKSSQSALLFSHVDSNSLLVAPKQCPGDLEKKVKKTTIRLSRRQFKSELL